MPRRATLRRLPMLITVLALAAAACGDDDSADAPDSSADGGSAVAGDITVFAAASLTGAFTDIGDAFSAENPDASATFSFDASSALVQQIIEGAPANVYASADTSNMDKLVDAGLDGTEPVVFATNVLTIIVAPGNPEGITGVEDLANPDLTTVICAPEVPCGKYAAQIFDSAEVTVSADSLEQNVKGVVTKVTSGEADAGIVYVTDVMAVDDQADMVEIPAAINVEAQYPVAIVKDSASPDVSQAFIDFLLGAEGQAILKEYGFGAAP